MRARRVAAVLLAAGVLVACGDSPDTSTEATATTKRSTTTRASTSSTTVAGARVDVRIYLLRDGKVTPVSRSVRGPGTLRAALTSLFDGPTPRDQGLASEVDGDASDPDVKLADGTATIDLPDAFVDGPDAAVARRAAQVVYTATQFPSVERVLFRVGGEPIDDLGGVDTSGPVTRADFEAQTPLLLVETPLPGSTVPSTFSVKGTGNTFEAAFHVTVTVGDGEVVYDEPGMATSGTGTRGTFDHKVVLPTGAAGRKATLKVFEDSAEDGRPVNVVAIDLTIEG